MAATSAGSGGNVGCTRCSNESRELDRAVELAKAVDQVASAITIRTSILDIVLRKDQETVAMAR